MFFNRIALSDLKVENGELKNEITRLNNELARYRAMVEDIQNDLTKCEPAIDFKTMRVFSIERHVSNNRPCTIIGHFMNDPVLSKDGEMIKDRDITREWTLYCSNERHAELVAQFKAFNELQ